MLRSERSFVLYSVEIRHFGNIINASKILKCGAGEGWRRLITWHHRVKNDDALQTVKEERNSLHTRTMKWWKATWTGHTLCMNCFLKHVTGVKKERKIEENGRQGRWRKQILDEGNKQILETERGSTRSLFLENSLWKRLRTCRKTDYVMKITHCTSIHTVAYSFRSRPLRSTSFPIHLSPIPSFDAA